MNIKSLISNIRTQDESKQKKVVAILAAVLAVLFLLGSLLNGNSGEKASKKPIKTAASAEKVVVQNKQSVNVTEPAGKKGEIKGSVDIAQIYPFVDPNAGKGGVVMAANGTMPAINSGSNGLPAIPNYQPVPNVGNIPLPAISNAPTMATNSMMPPGTINGMKQNVVQGVLTSDSGKNMAIMSDGKVVQEGDTYGGERISYITGEGVHFDNGNDISYGIK